MTGKLKIVAAVLLTAGLLLILIAVLSRPATPQQQIGLEVAPEDPGFPVVVARTTLPFGEPVQSEMVTVEKSKQKQDGTYGDINEVIGRIPVLTVRQGQKVTRTAFETNPLADQVRTGFRAVAIRTDEQMAGIGRLRPGDIVDVFSVFRRDDRDIASTQARQVLARLRVISVGPKIVGQAENREPENPNAPGSGNSNAGQTNMRNVTLEVPISDVNLLLLAQQQGNLMLAIRNPEDAGAADREAFPEPVALLKKKDSKDSKDSKGRKAQATELSADDKAYAGVAVDSVVGGAPPRPIGSANPSGAAAMPVARTDAAAKPKKEAREEPPKTEMIRRGKTTSEAAQ